MARGNAKLSAVRSFLVEERERVAAQLAALSIHIEAIDEALSPPAPPYDTVPLADVAEKPHVEPAMMPMPDATPTRATMRRPAPTPADAAATPRPPMSISARVLAYLAEHREASPGDLAAALAAHQPSVLTTLSKLLRDKQVTKRPNGRGKGVLYALPGAEPSDAAPAAEAPKPAAPPAPAVAPPVALPKPNGSTPPELTGALKLIARDVLKGLQLGPLTEMQLFQKTGWPVGSIHTVANVLKAEGRIVGAAKLSLRGAGE